MRYISSCRRIAKVHQPSWSIRRVFCTLFLILATFASDVFGAEAVAVHASVFVAGYGETAVAAAMFAAGAPVTLGVVKMPVERAGMEGAGKNLESAFGLAYVRLAIAVLFAVIILAVRYAVFRRKGSGVLRVVIEDSEIVTEYRETELHDMPRSFVISDLISCEAFGNEGVAFTVPLIGERLHVENYSELTFFKNGREMPGRFSIIFGDTISLRIQKFDVTIVYLDE